MDGWPEWIDGLRGLDQRAFLSLNGWLHGTRGIAKEAVDTLMAFANGLGTAWVFLAVAVAGGVLCRDHGCRVRVFAELGLAGLLVWGGVQATKDALPRDRPQRTLAASFGDGSAVAGFGDELRSRSFPSGHAATAFAVAGVLWGWAARGNGPARRRVARTSVIAIASLTGVSRVYAGVHYPLDVVGGAVLGCLCAGAAFLLVRLVAGERAPPVPVDVTESSGGRTVA